MRRGERLAERAGVVGLSTLVGHALDALVACSVRTLRDRQDFLDLGLIGVDLDLALVENSAEILMIFGMQDFPDMFEGKSLIDRLLSKSCTRLYRAGRYA